MVVNPFYCWRVPGWKKATECTTVEGYPKETSTSTSVSFSCPSLGFKILVHFNGRHWRNAHADRPLCRSMESYIRNVTSAKPLETSLEGRSHLTKLVLINIPNPRDDLPFPRPAFEPHAFDCELEM